MIRYYQSEKYEKKSRVKRKFSSLFLHHNIGMWKKYNPNPAGAKVGDCTIRALSKALHKSWQETYIDLCTYGYFMCDMPSANNVWGRYLKENGFERHMAPELSVNEFLERNPEGIYVMALSGHVVCAVDGDYYDTWESGNEMPIYYWRKKQ